MMCPSIEVPAPYAMTGTRCRVHIRTTSADLVVVSGRRPHRAGRAGGTRSRCRGGGGCRPRSGTLVGAERRRQLIDAARVDRRHRPGSSAAGRGCEAEVLTERRARVLGPERAALLQQRDDLVGEPVEAAGRDVRHQDEAVAGVVLDVAVEVRGDRLRRADEGLARGSSRSSRSRIERPRPSARSRHSAGDRDRVARRRAAPRSLPGAIALSVSTSGRRRAAGRRGRSPTGRGSTAARGTRSPCGPLTCWRRTRRRARAPPRRCRRGRRSAREDQQLVGLAAVAGEPPLDVGVERLAGLERAVAREDPVGVAGGELAPVVGVAGLDDRPAGPGRARHGERPAMSTCVPWKANARRRPATNARRASATISPAAHESQSAWPPRRTRRRGRSARRREVAAAAEVRAGERVGGGDEVPARAAAGEVVERAELRARPRAARGRSSSASP